MKVLFSHQPDIFRIVPEYFFCIIGKQFYLMSGKMLFPRKTRSVNR